MAPTLDKYDHPLTSSGAPVRPPAVRADAKLLFQIRNPVVHYLPRDHLREQEVRRLEGELKKRIKPNPLVGPAQRAYWLEHAMGSPLALWAIETAVALTGETCSAVGVLPSYARHKRGSWFDQIPGHSEVPTPLDSAWDRLWQLPGVPWADSAVNLRFTAEPAPNPGIATHRASE